MECLSCRSLSGEQRISPAPAIYDGTYWVVEHGYPSALKGWLVLVLKRHAEALHELTPAEFAELANLQGRAARALHMLLECEKEYVMALAERTGFQHVHVHIVPRPRDLPEELRGPRIFALLNVAEEEAAPPADVHTFCEVLRVELARND
jgi:diadenosine tetraphosphate (Ap4A) HIT family hydrolase